MRGKRYRRIMENKFYSEDDLIPVSALSDFVFCARRAALHFIEGIWEDNLFTAEGTILHERVDDGSSTETRGNIRITRSIPLRSLALGLTGKADVVEFHRKETGGIKLKGVSGLWLPFPVEYKRGHFRNERSFEVQLCAQAICLEEMMNVEIPKGAVFYGQTRRRYDVKFDSALRKETEEAAMRLHELIESQKTPEPEYSKRCKTCSLFQQCMPEPCSKKNKASRYLSNILKQLDSETSSDN